MSDGMYSRLVIFVAGLLGAAGVAMAAAAAHAGEARFFGPAAAMCLAHAPALLAIEARCHRPRLATVASAFLGGGAIIFSGDLAARATLDHSAFAMAAPIGGMLMILGWTAMALSAFAPTPR